MKSYEKGRPRNAIKYYFYILKLVTKKTLYHMTEETKILLTIFFGQP